MTLEERPDGVVVPFKVLADSDRTAILDPIPPVRVAVKSPARHGQANKELLRLLGRTFGLPPSAFRILSGHHKPLKRVLCPLPKDRLLSTLRNL